MNTYTPNSSKIVHYTYVDFSSRLISRPVHIVQYDDSIPILAVKLYNDGQAYTVPSNANINIRLSKRDGNFVYNPALGCDSSKQTVYFEITQQMAVLSGEVSPVVEIEINNEYAASGSVGIVIDKNPIQQISIESTTEYITGKQFAQDAIDAAARAAASQSAAKTSETNAANSKAAAAASQTAAKTSETNAKQYADNAKTSETNAKASETSALKYSNQAKAALNEILGADIGQFGVQLANQHCVTQPVYDSSGELIIDSNNNNIESRTIFADIGEITSIKNNISALEYILMEILHKLLPDRMDIVEKTIISMQSDYEQLETHTLLDSSY